MAVPIKLAISVTEDQAVSYEAMLLVLENNVCHTYKVSRT